ncbi:MAG: head GIN domain-containing protein [Fulvivirga sp.]|nr:head GIN domain-containing protein [Fulvivirga sp.]
MKNFAIILSTLLISSGLTERGPDITTKKLDLPEFHSIYVNSGYTVNLKQTNKQEVEVIALTEIYEISEFVVKDGILHINVELKNETKDKSVWEKIDNIKISPEMTLNVSMRDIKVLKVNGSGKLLGQNSIASNDLDLAVTGSGEMAVDVKGRNLNTSISGSGSLKIKGYADYNDIKISGSGTLKAYGCELTRAEVKVSGSGTCEINVTEKLEVTILGSGIVQHKGQTKNVTKKIYGSGEVKREY